MDKSLGDVRKKIARRFLGRAGIHGVGANDKLNQIRIFLTIDKSLEQKHVLDEISKSAGPFEVKFIDDDEAELLIK